MNKQDFLAELRQRLGKVDETTRNEVCADIEGHFEEGASQGYTEEEICRNLGSPSAIAEQLTEEYAGTVDARPPLAPDSPHAGQQNAGHPASGHPSGAAPQSTLQSIIGGLTASYDINIDRSFTGVSDIDIKLASNNLTVRPSGAADDTVRVTIRGTSRYNLFKVEQRGSELFVYENTPWFRLDLFFFAVKLETVVYVPSGFNGNIRAKNSNGVMKIYEVNGGNLEIHSSAGNVSAEQCTFNRIDAHASAGNLHARKLNGNFIKLHSSAGNVEAEDLLGELDAHSAAGNVRITRHEGRFMKVNASAGKAVITDCSAAIDAHSSAGSIDISCERTSLGDVKATSPAGTVKLQAMEIGNIRLDSSAGSVKTKIGRLNGNADISASAGNVHLELREINGNVRVSSAMGSVKMRLPDPCSCRIEATSRMGAVRNHVRHDENGVYTVKADASMGSITIEGC